ncbi:hypothetical protein LOTGIDRAFT_155770 [Lottia gigantea]|uniref:Uncharacterized protein n=1 Tax=Lottia gigantea TaxID=225164 RepID=V3ZF60_LOTGI|nr:hypothetical protein LOTGIDRAFT_155770 [Lottia gigantea]ESO82752.1 hypothetical protein LOTGIDRAFT_155770 [Lottia gigantea]
MESKLVKFLHKDIEQPSGQQRLTPLLLSDSKGNHLKLSGCSKVEHDILIRGRGGRRIIDLDQLQKHVSEITMHTALCSEAQMCALVNRPVVKLVAEKQRLGLASIMQAECQGCGQLFQLSTSKKTTSSSGLKRYDINLRAVWGSMVTGSGLSHLSECLGTMGVPSMSQPTFTAIEQEIGNWWYSVLKEDMFAAGAEEKRLAEERNNYHQGVPAITVVCDGGWSKRSHKHSYNALGGVGIIIGQVTRKLLHIGIRNKYCYTCSLAESRQKDPGQHECFKNWDESSQAMEADVIVEGFMNAEKDHGVRYMRLVADGDSSVYARIQKTVPIWGPHVTKLECANHACKCLRSSLEKLVDRLPKLKGRGKLTLATRIRIVSAVRCAIRMRSSEENRSLACKKLVHDIKNCIYHVFGDHTRCPEFCKKSSGEIPSTESSPTSTCEDEQSESVISVVGDQQDFWTDGSSLKDQEDSRLAVPGRGLSAADKEIINEVCQLLNRIASKAERLLGNFTTNLAEAWMNIRAKFDGGKFFNRCSRGSWHCRCYGGALRQIWEPSGHLWYGQREKRLQLQRLLSARPVQKAKRWKRRMIGRKQSDSTKARQEYGTDVIEVVADYSSHQLSILKAKFDKDFVQLSKERVKEICEATIDQSDSDIWHDERRKRLTSSNFGDIMARNSKIAVTTFIKRLLYSTFKGNRFTKIGLAAEKATVSEYCAKKATDGDPVTVEHTGLQILHSHPFLAASTDGIVSSLASGEKGLLEVKNVLMNKQLTFLEAVKSVSNFCLIQSSRNQLVLKRNHKFYYQVQGQLNVFDMKWLDFVVRSSSPHQLHIERIVVDKNLWVTKMLPKLTPFYYPCLLPELCAPRYGRSPGIREPGVWYLQKDTKPKQESCKLSCSGTKPQTTTRSTNRATRQRFVGREISHKWIVDESSDNCKWYHGSVLDVTSGLDGNPDAVYDIYYHSEDETYSINHLVQDFKEDSVKFIDA